MNFNNFSLFKYSTHRRRFGYVPRYYDKNKEELKKKVAAAKKEQVLDENGNYAREISFRQKTGDRWGNSMARSGHFRANIRLIIVLAIVILAFYFIFRGLDVIGPTIDSLKK